MTAPTAVAPSVFSALNPQRLLLWWPSILCVALAFAASHSVAQVAATPASAVAASAPKTPASAPAKAASAKSGWAALSAPQQQALKPLASSWDGLSDGQKRKWLEISKNYPRLANEDQTKMHSRMTEWIALSPSERAQARLNFAKTTELSKSLSAEEKKAKWEAYQSLSAEEKKSLADKGNRKPVGAAPATRPVAPQKLATVPTPASKPLAKSAAIPSAAPSAKASASPASAAASSAASPPSLPASR